MNILEICEASMKKSTITMILNDSRLYILLMALLLVILSSSLLGTSKQEIRTLQIENNKIENEIYQIPQDDVECNNVKYMKH